MFTNEPGDPSPQVHTQRDRRAAELSDSRSSRLRQYLKAEAECNGYTGCVLKVVPA